MTSSQKAKRNFPLVPVLFGVVAIALITVVVLTFEGDGGGGEFGEPEVTGTALAPLPQSGPDPALGSPAPEMTGADFDDTPVSITNDGNAKIILFLAHWCPHCQREVPVVTDWLSDNPLPDGVDFYAVATSISSTRENYPPSAWLERENWPTPVIVDDAASTVGNTFGLTAFPFWVFTAADGTVLARVTGGVTPADLDAAVAQMAATTG